MTILKRNFFYVDSATGSHFTGPLTQNASEFENLQIAGAAYGAMPITIGSIRIISAENLNWEVQLLSSGQSRTAGGGELATPFNIIGRWSFVAADAVRLVQLGYLYDVDGLDLLYRDADSTGQIHVALYNRNATAKSAGAAGFVHLRIGCLSES